MRTEGGQQEDAANSLHDAVLAPDDACSPPHDGVTKDDLSEQLVSGMQ